ncbi:unnamed protein product, partial [Coregonus sp. 'balchen']
VPELAGFWLISFLFQLPILLFFLTDEDIIILPLERAFGEVENLDHHHLHHLHHHHLHHLRPAGKSPAFGMPNYGRTVLPMPPYTNNVHSH